MSKTRFLMADISLTLKLQLSHVNGQRIQHIVIKAQRHWAPFTIQSVLLHSPTKDIKYSGALDDFASHLQRPLRETLNFQWELRVAVYPAPSDISWGWHTEYELICATHLLRNVGAFFDPLGIPYVTL